MGSDNQYVRAYHLIITAYGFWLPNDPRGSWSDTVRAFDLLRFGPATKVNDPRSHAYRPHDRWKRLEAKEALTRPPVRFNGHQARAIASGFSRKVRSIGFVVYACAVMRDHAHLVIARSPRSIENICGQLKASASLEMLTHRLHPFQDESYADGTRPSPWARGHWAPFLWDNQAIERAVRYVNNNPTRDGMKKQNWTFVTPFVRRE
jgi:REP element-mobilizing transposase RayT